ncbi:MAG: phage major capsid protein [Lachnospiraceae bacterium]|nr:phage major capsid protein [Lachnospiraceae bacterium]
MKFKNYKEYMELRDNLLAEAQKASEEGNQEEFDAKSKEITDLDAEWDAFAQRQANLNALKGAPKAPMGMVEQTNTVMTELVADSDMEYRKAFMNYVLKGTPIKMQNGTDYQTTTSDVGPVIPTTIMNRIVELIESNGNILAKVTRTAFKGGVKVPVSSAKPTAVWLAERAGGNTQKMDVSGSVVFAYYKLKVSVAVSLIVENVTLDIFEKTLAANIAEAMVRALEDAIINGTGTGQPKGILAETAAATIEADVTRSTGDGVTYATLLAMEGALPTAYENGAEWVMNKKFFYNYIQAIVDSNGQPIARVDAGIDGKLVHTIFGRPVNFTDHMAVPTNDAPTGVFAFIAKLEDYMINTNMDVTVSRYVDESSDDTVTKAIMIADGKMIDTHSIIALELTSD